MSSSELHTLYKAFTAAGGHWSTFLVWAKDHFTLGRSDYQRQYEAILYGWREGQEHFWSGARNEGDIWFVPKPKVNRLHPTMKPVSLIERAIRNSSQRGGLVLVVRLPAPIRADSLRLERGNVALLVRSARQGRRLVHESAARESAAPHHEAGRAGIASHRK